MITLTRLSGSAFVLNADLIERIDSTPDSVVTLVDGKKYIVKEPLAAIVLAVQAYRGQIIAFSHHLESRVEQEPIETAPDDRTTRPSLAPVSRLHEEG